MDDKEATEIRLDSIHAQLALSKIEFTNIATIVQILYLHSESIVT
jgi:hypothetical protein